MGVWHVYGTAKIDLGQDARLWSLGGGLVAAHSCCTLRILPLKCQQLASLTRSQLATSAWA
jgi:hypothetical protein